MSKYNPSKEYGVSGLIRYDGYIQEEFLRELDGDKKIKIYNEMVNNDAIVGGVMYAIQNIIAQVKFRVDPGGESDDDKLLAEFVESCRHDMSSSWDDTVNEILSFLTMGFSYHELVYKRRMGPYQPKAEKRSKYDDGKIGWRKIAGRSQEGLVDNWDFDETGGIQGVTQKSPPDYIDRYIPIEKALLFRTTTKKGNPEGKSLIRSAYRSWFFKKNIQNLEAIGIERDLVGLPVMTIPANVLSGKSDDDKKALIEYKNIITNVRRDEQEGLLLPATFDEKGNKLVELQLLSSGGSRTFDTSGIIRRYDQDIALSVLADFILLGTQGVGSFALSKEKTNIFAMAVTSFLDSMVEVFNRHAIPRLLALNGYKTEAQPNLAHGGVKSVDLTVLATYLSTLSVAGADIFPNEDLEDYLRKVANLPERKTED